ncbi:MAG: hypothetical protein AABY87_12865 [bacterium]
MEDHPRRGVAFLISRDRKVTAKTFFDNLDRNSTTYRMLMTRFDAWRDGQPNQNSRYHGWNQSEFGGKYTKCFVFKYKAQRLYGFLYNPKPSDRSYQVCIVVKHAVKNKNETDETDLKNVEEIRTTLDVQRAINNYFKER